MQKNFPSPFPLILLFIFLQCTTTCAQTLAPTGPDNITAILSKAGQFTTLIRLLTSTKMADQMNTQLNNSNQGITIFAPTDNAFSSLSPGTLNSLTDQQKVQLVQYHVIPSLISMSQFQTASNPLRTQAGNSNGGQFPLNVTTSGNQVNITTGVVTATVANTIYSDTQLAVYQVDNVLLPLELFPPAPAVAPALAPAKAGKDVPSSSHAPTADSSVGTSGDSSAALGLTNHRGVTLLPFGIAVMAAFSLWV